MPDKTPETEQGFTPEELEQQDGEPLPDREAMSLLQPDPYPLPVPIDDAGTAEKLPGHTMPVEPPATD